MVFRILSHEAGKFDDNQRSRCFAACEGYAFAGLEYGKTCFCGNTLPNSDLLRPGECTTPCPGNAEEMCGGGWRMNLVSVPGKLNLLQYKRTFT